MNYICYPMLSYSTIYRQCLFSPLTTLIFYFYPHGLEGFFHLTVHSVHLLKETQPVLCHFTTSELVVWLPFRVNKEK